MKTYWKRMINCSVLAGLSCVALTGLNADSSAQEPPKKVDIELTLEMNALPPVELRSPFENQSFKCKVHSTSWNHDASWLAAGVTCKNDHTVNSAHVQLLQKDTLIPLFIRIPSGETVRKVNAVFSPDGSLLAVSTDDKAIRFYDVHKGFKFKHVHELGDNNYLYPSFAFSPDGTLFAVGDERDINLYSLKSDFLHLGTIKNTRPVDIRFISDNNTLAVKSFFDIKVFHSKDSFSSSEVVKSSKLERRRRYHRGFASSPDGSIMAFSSSGGEIKFLDDRACKKKIWISTFKRSAPIPLWCRINTYPAMATVFSIRVLYTVILITKSVWHSIMMDLCWQSVELTVRPLKILRFFRKMNRVGL